MAQLNNPEYISEPAPTIINSLNTAESDIKTTDIWHTVSLHSWSPSSPIPKILEARRLRADGKDDDAHEVMTELKKTQKTNQAGEVDGQWCVIQLDDVKEEMVMGKQEPKPNGKLQAGEEDRRWLNWGFELPGSECGLTWWGWGKWFCGGARKGESGNGEK